MVGKLKYQEFIWIIRKGFSFHGSKVHFCQAQNLCYGNVEMSTNSVFASLLTIEINVSVVTKPYFSRLGSYITPQAIFKSDFKEQFAHVN